MKVKWLGHACFLLQGSTSLIFDPFKGTGLADLVTPVMYTLRLFTFMRSTLPVLLRKVPRMTFTLSPTRSLMDLHLSFCLKSFARWLAMKSPSA